MFLSTTSSIIINFLLRKTVANSKMLYSVAAIVVCLLAGLHQTNSTLGHWKRVTNEQTGQWQSTSDVSTISLETCISHCSMTVASSLLLTFFESNRSCSCFTKGITTTRIASSTDKIVYIRPSILTYNEKTGIIIYFPEIQWKVYLSTAINSSWEIAYNGCKTKGGRLAIIDTQEKYDALFYHILNKTTSFHVYINGRYLGNQTYGWYEHPEINFPDSFWFPGEPLSFDDCVMFWQWDYMYQGFDDQICTYLGNFLCEIP